MKEYEVLEHTADIGIKASGKSLAETFTNTARGMFSLVVNPKSVASLQEEELAVEAEDTEALLVEWLNELLYRLEVDQFLGRDFYIDEITGTNLHARVKGERIDPQKHRIKLQIKACTYHQLKVAKDNGYWTAQVIFDI